MSGVLFLNKPVINLRKGVGFPATVFIRKHVNRGDM